MWGEAERKEKGKEKKNKVEGKLTDLVMMFSMDTKWQNSLEIFQANHQRQKLFKKKKSLEIVTSARQGLTLLLNSRTTGHLLVSRYTDLIMLQSQFYCHSSKLRRNTFFSNSQ